MSIPLVQNNEKDSINTSIIAIKRNIERINMLLGLVDSGSPDLSGLATKQELEDAITQVETDLAPVDEVTSGNMQSVSSNAVAEAIKPLEKLYVLESGVLGPYSIAGNNNVWQELQLRHTYGFTNIQFMLTPVSYVDCAYVTVSGHWGAHGSSSQGLTQSNKLTVFITNTYSGAQTCGVYWAILGTKDSIVS